MSSDLEDDAQRAARREFLTKCGKFAAVTPVAMSVMMAASKQNFAVASSHGNISTRANNGFGNGPRDGIPGNSAGKGANGKKHGPITDVDR